MTLEHKSMAQGWCCCYKRNRHIDLYLQSIKLTPVIVTQPIGYISTLICRITYILNNTPIDHLTNTKPAGLSTIEKS